MGTARAESVVWPRPRGLFGPLGRLAPLWALALTLGACAPGDGVQIELAGPTMGTYYNVKVVNPPPGATRETLHAGVEGVLAEVNRLISTYDPDSELSRFNRHPGTDWVGISPELLGVVDESLEISRLSGGAFDVTVGPLVNLWGFGPEPKPERVPPPEAIDRARERVGFHRLRLDPERPAMKKDRADVYVDLSALGEGYGADRVADYLSAQGVGDFMVAVAGAIRVRGHNAKGMPWAIAVEEPTPGRRAVHRIIQVTDGGLSTSGDYRNYFEEDGKRYSHEIDPQTGRPIEHRLASVTVIGETAARADGLATALMVLGEERGPQVAEAEGIAALFIVRTEGGFREEATPAFARYLSQ